MTDLHLNQTREFGIGLFQNLPHRQVLSLTNYNSIIQLNYTAESFSLQLQTTTSTLQPFFPIWCRTGWWLVVSVQRVCQYLHYHILSSPCKKQTPRARKIFVKIRADICLLYILCVSNYFCKVAAGWCVSNDRRTQNDNQCQKSILK